MIRKQRSKHADAWYAGVILALLFAVTATTSSANPPATTFCLPASDTSALYLLDRSKSFGASTAPIFVKLRTGIAMPAVPVAQIVPVTVEASCSRAAGALDSVHVGLTASPVYLVKVGTQYLTKRQDVDVIVQLNSAFTFLNRLDGQ